MSFIFSSVKKIFSWGVGLINKHTTGLPFLAWFGMGMVMSIFLFIFRKLDFIQFDKIVYILLFSMIWFVFSDIAKKKKIIEGDMHFFIDSIFYLGTFGSLFYYTHGMDGQLFFLFFLIAISAPLFSSILETITLLFFAFLVTNGINWMVTSHAGDIFSYYETGIIFLAFLFHIGVAMVIKLFQNDYQKQLQNVLTIQEELAKTNERLYLEIKDKEVLHKKIEERTKQLEKIKSNLQQTVEDQTKKLREELEQNKKINEVTIDRELKMIELKRMIKELKKK